MKTLYKSVLSRLSFGIPSKGLFQWPRNSKEVFPTNKQAIVVGGGKKSIEGAVWGFAPPFAKRPLINARGETVHEKPTFKEAFLMGRCIVPATSFFEWEKMEDKKIRREIRVRDQEIFSMAGLYSTFRDKAGLTFVAFTIITTEANSQMKKIHDRMPVILHRDKEDLWLNREERDLDRLKSLMAPTDLVLEIE